MSRQVRGAGANQWTKTGAEVPFGAGGRRRPSRFWARLLVLLLAAPVVVGLPPGDLRPAAAEPAGFTQQVVFSGLTRPTKLVFAPDGRVFVAQKNGMIKLFDSLSDPTPTVFADLRPNVYDYEDLGLISMALPPNFPTDPYVYVSYTYDGVVGGTAPTYNDSCPVVGNCRSSARVSRLRASGDVMTGSEQVLLHDWCHQIESHSIGDLAFGPEGALYVAGGEGASATFVDYGQAGSPSNPCGDPPAPVGGAMTAPTAEGGALRAQDVRTSGDPTGLSGTLIRIDPATGAALPDNPMAGSADPNIRRILAYGLRNPFRWTFRPGTGEVWFGDVGWRTWEEIDRVVSPVAGPVRNYGWPCYEGNGTQSGYNSANLNLCESLYTAPAGTVTPPYWTYSHSQSVVAGDGCPTGGSSPSGMAFYPTSGGGYPAAYAGALFFADYSRGCIWAMRAGAGGLPDPANIVPFSTGTAGPVDLRIGPDNDLYYVDLPGGTVRRFHYNSGNQPPVAVAAATPTSGNAPLEVAFDGSGSTDPDTGDILSYQWDFTNDGTIDATGVTASHTYPATGTWTARLRVTDIGGLADTATVQIRVGTSAPEPVIDSPIAALRWAVGDTVNFSGHATDPQDGTLPPAALSWHLINRHCDLTGSCHTHVVRDVDGVASGFFLAPDHEYPSYLELTLTATDSGGLTGSTTVRLDPRTVDISLASEPTGLELNLDGLNYTTPATAEVIVGSTTTLSAPSPQTLGSRTYAFGNWSDGGGQTHVVIAPATATSYRAVYTDAGCADSFGYTCVTTNGYPWQPADQTVLPLAGDNAVTSVTLPFPMPFYGQRYDRAWVDVNGSMSFLDPGGSWPVNRPLPYLPAPNATLYPFWDDLEVRADSSVRTALLGSAPDRRFVVEWRNMGLYGAAVARISFEVVLAESGQIGFNYTALNAGRELGNSATVGIENGTGTVAVQYSINQAVLSDNRAIIFTAPDSTPPPLPPPSTGTVSGTVTSAATGVPVAGATVSLAPGGAVTSTGTGGSYTLGGVVPGDYTVTGTASDSSTASAPVTVVAGTTTRVDLALVPPPPPPPPPGGGTYLVGTESRPFQAADGGDLLALTGDDGVTRVALPFPVPLYGQAYGSAWVSSNGWLSFVDPGGPQGVETPVPDVAAPNAAVYPFWDDLYVRSDSSIRTAVLDGTPGSRRFVVEWRNIGMYGSSSARITVSAVLSETGEIVFHYADLSTLGRERGDSATVGIENATGTAATQYSYHQAVLVNGTALVFRPAP